MEDFIVSRLRMIWDFIWGLVGPFIESVPVWKWILIGVCILAGTIIVVRFWNIVRVVLGVLMTAGYIAGLVWITMQLWEDRLPFLIFLIEEVVVVLIFSVPCLSVILTLFDAWPSNPIIPDSGGGSPAYRGSQRNESSEGKSIFDIGDPNEAKDGGAWGEVLERNCRYCAYYDNGACTNKNTTASYPSPSDVCSRFSKR